MLQKYIKIIDGLIAKIPHHIQDVIAKGFLALFAISALFAVATSWQKGKNAAQPQGLQMAKDTQDIFAGEIQKLRNRRLNQAETDGKGIFDYIHQKADLEPVYAPPPGSAAEESDGATSPRMRPRVSAEDRRGARDWQSNRAGAAYSGDDAYQYQPNGPTRTPPARPWDQPARYNNDYSYPNTARAIAPGPNSGQKDFLERDGRANSNGANDRSTINRIGERPRPIVLE